MSPSAVIEETASNGFTNGLTNGDINGHTNGQANGAVNGAANGIANGHHDDVEVTKRYPDNGLKVLIVGCGPAGLMAALECWRKGCTVQLIDRSDKPLNTGDVFCLQPSCMSVFRHWPRMSKEIEAEQLDAKVSYLQNNGDKIYGPDWPEFNDEECLQGRKGPRVGFMQGRVLFFQMLVRQVERLGIPLQWNQRVMKYFELTDAGIAGVELENGERRTADIVIAADGINTRSGELIEGYSATPKDSGQSMYRSGYSPKFVANEPMVHERWPVKEGEQPEWQFWLSQGLHLSVLVSKSLIVWGLTHKDEYNTNSGESWEHFVSADEVCDLMEREAPGWDPAVKALIGTTPKGTLVHWKLRWRDLNEQWTTPGGRIVQIGDSAHSFLPASGNGATQALEDAVSLASCLHLAGRSNAAIATKVHNKLRYERISCSQIMSFVNSQAHHYTDWSAIAKNPKLIRTKFPKWVWQHDPEEYAYQKYGEGYLHVVSDGEVPLVNTNYPPGHTHKKWSVDEVRADLTNNVNIGAKLDGDWS